MSANSMGGRYGSPCRLVAFASGKGGVGKTICASNLALHTSQKSRVLAVDLDIGCGNLNASLGVRSVRSSIEDFLNGRVRSLDEITVKTAVEGLQMISCSYKPSSSTALSRAQTDRLIQHLRRQDADYVFMDLGAGVGEEVLDLFAAADLKVVVTAPESLALHDAFMFVKAVAYRVVSRGMEQPQFSKRRREKIVQLIYGSGEEELSRTIDRIGFGDAKAAAAMRELLSTIKISVVLNKVQEAGEEKFVAKLRNLTRKYVDLDLDFIGSIPFDQNVKKSLNEIAPFALEYQLSPANAALKQIALKMRASLASADVSDNVQSSLSSGPLTRAVSLLENAWSSATGRFR